MSTDEVLMQQLIKEANDNGFSVRDFNELNSIKRKLRNFIPVLIKYIHDFQECNYKDAIVGLLGVKGFYDATELLLHIYKSKDAKVDKWGIGDALYFIGDKRFEDEYIEIISDKDNGISRQMIVLLLGKLRCIRAIPVFIDLLHDDDVNGHVIMSFGYFKDEGLLKYIEPFLNHEKRWIRKEAEKSIKKIKN